MDGWIQNLVYSNDTTKARTQVYVRLNSRTFFQTPLHPPFSPREKDEEKKNKHEGENTIHG